ncbi:kinase-like protein [Trametes versicolor FP-101664 SS1]|uniref:kinase-like protein n=1 Tax=Trametes versicolor (strain FP-101664) TaxID=717944 RepID=UPI000462291A|nr:kinase-like protein [Trametes versicolor FP-101664 SS1]EIW63835.1 kinase-like protein [Trametes versicolor FP-101664 SS1]
MPGKNISSPVISVRRLHRVEEGPWTISVAETPHDPSSYSLYIKTPTHNITLTRTAQEVVELHAKLRDNFPGLKIPSPPIDVASLPVPPKRKSAFLNTLSRLASPSGNKSNGTRQASGRQQPSSSLSSSAASSNASSSAQTPSATPANEIGDPFAEIGENGEDISALAASNNKVITGLASYLTSIANETTLRQARAWKRFVRVRTDDLQSVRVERAIKRVRSDIAAHASPTTSSEATRSISQVVLDGEDAAEQDGIREEDADADVDEDIAEGAEDRAATPVSPKPAPKSVDGLKSAASQSATSNGDVTDDEFAPNTPVQGDSAASHSRIMRSQSADPMARASRVYSTTPSQASQTDASSVSTTERRSARKKRSKSTDPNSAAKKSQRKVVVDDFEMMRVLGKGCAGKVLLVRHKPSQDVYALKAITKRHVLAHQELQHTLTEQAVLKRMAAENSDPFVVKLWWSFHDKENLFLVMDFHPGGDLATQLARWGRLGRDRARFYAAEIVEGVEGLHAAGVIYRDLKPENILIGADGHIVLTDFGLSKEFPRRTAALTAPSTPSGSRGEFMDTATAPASTPSTPHWMKGDVANDMFQPSSGDTTSTFCGTAEYLAPEVIQGLPYSYEVDWWSFGTMLYEMLTGITPFWAENHSDMYYRVLQDELQFPEDRTMDQDTKSLIRGLLQRNPALRMKEPRVKKHPYFSMIDWSHVYYKRYIPPYIPPIDPSNASDTQNFDDTFLGMEPVINDENEEVDTDAERTDTDRTDGEDSVATPSQSRSPSVHPVEDDSVDVFDGYSYKGRHSVIIDDEEEDGDGEDEEDEDEESISPSLDSILPEEPVSDVATVPEEVEEVTVPEDVGETEPKTPEARPAALPTEPEAPPALAPVEPAKPEAAPAPSHDRTATTVSSAEAAAAAAASRTAEDANIKTAPKVRAGKQNRNRREKSGIPALDRDIPDARTEDEGLADREEDEDDWDFVEAGGLLVEERNGSKGTTLFARGVVDRYKLSVFRKSTPRRSTPRSFSGVSLDSELEPAESPTPSDKQRRGRTPGLTFRKHPRQFLRQKSPPPSSRSAKSLTASASATMSAASTVSSAGLLTPSPSQTAMSHSLKSKESAISMGTVSESSDPSLNGDNAAHGGDTVKGAAVNGNGHGEDEKQQKNKVLKKYKEGAEKVLSIFQSPR